MIDLVVGARPNFVKAAPLLRALRGAGVSVRLVHTGQHADPIMTDAIARDVGLPAPDLHLGALNGAWPLPAVMDAYRAVLGDNPPETTIVLGDVDSTLACALAAKRVGVRVVHVEAGLRAGDPWMPEEQNRRLTDALADVLFVSERSGIENLRSEGTEGAVHLVGNVMIDALVWAKPEIDRRAARKGRYVVVTMHRPSNVDDPERAGAVVDALVEAGRNDVRVVFPMHPRTCVNWRRFGLFDRLESVAVTGPMGYLDFMAEVASAVAVVTDSGGVQEEATWLGVPCLTLRPSTERPVTVSEGSNELVEPGDLAERLDVALRGEWKPSGVPDLWDGRASERIARVLAA